MNEITPIGVSYLAEVLPTSGIKILNLSKNLLGDESLMIIAEKAEGAVDMKLQKIEVNSSRIADAGKTTNVCILHQTSPPTFYFHRHSPLLRAVGVL